MNLPTLTIPKPCHENWDAMTPENKGRFCGMCQKTVVDFTEMAPSEIGHFFQEHKGQKICGRFRGDQLAQPTEPLLPEALVNRIASRPMGFRQMFVLALLVCMGGTLFSCNNTKGEPAVSTETPVDTTAAVSGTTGAPVFSRDTNIVVVTKKGPKVCGAKEGDTLTEVKYEKMGDVAVGAPPTEETAHITGDTIVLPKQ